MSKVIYTAGGGGFSSLLFLLFLGLKLTGQINWSWWWVTAPLWLVPTILLTALMVIGFIWLGLHLITK